MPDARDKKIQRELSLMGIEAITLDEMTMRVDAIKFAGGYSALDIQEHGIKRADLDEFYWDEILAMCGSSQCPSRREHEVAMMPTLLIPDDSALHLRGTWYRLSWNLTPGEYARLKRNYEAQKGAVRLTFEEGLERIRKELPDE